MKGQTVKYRTAHILLIISIILCLPNIIYFSKNSETQIIKYLGMTIAALGFTAIGIEFRREIKNLESCGIQIMTKFFSYSVNAILILLGFLMLIQAGFEFNLNAFDTIVIISFAVSLIQLFTLIILKRYYLN